MQDILTNPITILCLGVVFLLISLLFFYFKRSISMIERAQMEQARVLQSFITNMEMSHMAQAQMMQQNSVNLNSNMNNVEEKNDLIHVSDDEGSDSDSDLYILPPHFLSGFAQQECLPAFCAVS